MLLQTLQFFDNDWCNNPNLISRYMRGLGNVIPPKPRYSVIWDVSKVLVYLSTLFSIRIFVIEDADVEAYCSYCTFLGP